VGVAEAKAMVTGEIFSQNNLTSSLTNNHVSAAYLEEK
jgi:hypothetical protein